MFGTNNDSIWIKQDADEDEDKDEDEVEEDNLLLTSLESFRMITKPILAEFTFCEKNGYRPTDHWTDGPTGGPTDRQSLLQRCGDAS